jgi:two-component system phosphate regulon response regulator OmpR
MQYHILVIDDDDEIRQLLAKYLNKNGYIVSLAPGTIIAESLFELFQFDLVILDVLMPKETGLDFLKRKTLKQPVIMLTALGDVDDRINGLESGAEDYIAKPFEPKELLIRIEKLISRFKKDSFTEKKIKFGDCQFDLENKNLLSNNKIIPLTTGQRDLLTIFATNLGIIISREEIAKQLNNINIRTIDTQITRLRSKIEKDPKSPISLQTVRNHGYVLWG